MTTTRVVFPTPSHLILPSFLVDSTKQEAQTVAAVINVPVPAFMESMPHTQGPILSQ